MKQRTLETYGPDHPAIQEAFIDLVDNYFTEAEKRRLDIIISLPE